MTHRFIALLLLPLLLLTACTDSREERQQLEELERQNRADSVMNDLALAQSLADHFDRHGTRNEQLRAHYILGRTHADRGELPQAVDCYLDAVTKADTASADCDYAVLGRVYSQMASLFHQQLLLSNEVHARQQASRCFLCAKDTFHAIYHQGMIAGNYILMNKRDSAEILLRETMRQYRAHGYEQDALQTSTMLMHLYAANPDRLFELKQLIDQYDHESELFDKYHELPPSKRLFYYYKGVYYEGINLLDSAEYYYRKIYRPYMAYTSQTDMYKGLLSVFRKRCLSDSIAKYAELYCLATDSSVIRHDQQQTAQLAASYDYSSYQRLAHQKEQEADQFKTTLIVVCSLSAIMILLFAIAYIRYRDEKQRLRDRIRLLSGYAVNKNLYDSPIAQHFRQLLKANPYQIPSLSDWKELKTVISQELPDFHEKLQTDSYQLSDNEYDICMLIKIQTSCSDIARLKQCTPSYVTQIRKNVYQRLFNKAGKADDLDEYIMSLS